MKKHHQILANGKVLLVALALCVTTMPMVSANMVEAESIMQSSDLKMVKGVVTDESALPLVGVTVQVKGNVNRGTITDVNGNFSLNCAVGEILIFSYIGYKSESVKITSAGQAIKLTMKEDSQTLSDVIVVGYGVQKKETLTGSVSSINNENIAVTKTGNVANNLVGRISGLTVNSRSGNPGEESTEITIRGLSTLGNHSPLYVIDGIANRDGFERLTAEDIESVSVLKDASAAIYGAQAANGVILVTTKRGKEGKPAISYNGTVSFTQPTRRPHLMNAEEYLTWVDEQNFRNGRPMEYQDVIAAYRNGTVDTSVWGNTDWWSEAIDKWSIEQQHNITLRGGNDKFKYYISGQYLDQDAIYKSQDYGYKQYNGRGNFDVQLSRNLKVGVDFSYRVGEVKSPTLSASDLIRQVFVSAPYDFPYYEDGTLHKTTTGNPIPLADGSSGNKSTKKTRLESKFSARWNLPFITKGLYMSGYFAYDYYTTYRKDLSNPYDIYTLDASTGKYVNNRDETGTTSLFQQFDHTTNKTVNLMLGYDRTFGNHRVSGFVAYEQYQHEYEFFSASRKNLVTPQLPYLFTGADEGQQNTGSGEKSARANFFGRLNYDYAGKYLAEFTLRCDGSANFAKGKRWGWFPGLSLGWRISEESFFNKNLFDNLKLRASWGMLGNDRVANFQYLQFYNLDSGNTSYVFGEKKILSKGLTPGIYPNVNITWETAQKYNLGIDFGLRSSMLTGSVEYFYERRSDILTPRNASVPVFTGLTLPDENIGKVSNQGVEVTLNHFNKIGTVNYNAGVNFSFAKSKIIYMDEAADTPEWQRRTNHPVDYLMVYKSDGFFQSQEEIDNYPHFADAKVGDVKFVDVNDDKVINGDDRIILSNSSTPKITYGITLGAEWKGFGINILLQGQGMAKTIFNPWDLNQDREYFVNRWTETNTNAKYPAAFDMSSSNIQYISDIWVKDVSFLRVKNVELSYRFEKQMLKKLGLQDLRLSVTGNNLFFIYDNVGFRDPESTDAVGWYYPQQRLITCGLNLTF